VGLSFNKARLGMDYTFIKVTPCSTRSTSSMYSIYILPTFNICRKIDFHHKFSGFENATVVATIQSQRRFSPSYFHSFGITFDAKKAVLIEQPLCINLAKAPMNKLKRQPPVNILSWIPNQKVRKVMVLYFCEPVENKQFFRFSEDNITCRNLGRRTK